ncbi:transposase [Paenibacillus larvae]|nr:transposase [Paenibacillus larvae]MDR5608827.1 transposase [Paenibacillus larvae]
MVKNRHLSKSIADAGWSQLVQYTMYKAESAGRVDPRHTSQLCSSCGSIVKKTLSVRVHRCDHCGYTADRDENAARNILQRALAS